jgi:MFS superfamily sulfate permease-like transporter
MRANTLHAILLVLALVILLGLKWLASSYTVHLPVIGDVSPLIAAVIVLPLVFVGVAVLNQPILAWRKAHGKDIVEEQKHEFDDADIISLRPRQPHEHSSTYRRWDPDN